MAKIQIEGLNARQRALADIIWTFNGFPEVNNFILSLKGPHKQDAITVIEMMVAAVMDECNEVEKSTEELLDKYRL